MTAGRPTKYSEEMLKLANAYIDQYGENGDVVPSVMGLARQLQVTEKTLYNWAEKEGNEEFLHTLEYLQEEQKRILVNKGLSGDFNATIAKLMLHNHGYSDKAEIDQKQQIEVIELRTSFEDNPPE